MNFKKGDSVVCKYMFGGLRLEGATGIVVSDPRVTDDAIGVQFDKKFPGGHTCSGRCPNGFGRFGREHELAFYDDTADNFNKRCFRQ